MIEANISCGSNTGKRQVVVDPLGSCSGTSAQYTGGAVTDFKSFRNKSRLDWYSSGWTRACLRWQCQQPFEHLRLHSFPAVAGLDGR